MKYTGTSIPVGSLKTKNSCGIGEFLDLIPFADFCKKSNLKIIQLLPVNDTGTESSPYSALSAFALHPLYIRLDALPELQESGKDEKLAEKQKKLLSKAKKIKKEFDAFNRFPYTKLRNAKLDFLKEVFDTFSSSILKDKDLKKWTKENPWVIDYAVFMNIKTDNFQASWKQWKKYKNITREEIEQLWNDKELEHEHIVYSWIQFRLHQQFLEASTYVQQQGIMLKGDIPIMMNEDSHDAWAYPEYFNDSLRAGSPPDGPNPMGQNWGFPTYNWNNLKKDDYSWWKNRLIQASKYYQMYRIDHVLGFFRIWAIPENECTAVLGHTEPFDPVTTQELHSFGFSDDRIRWMSKPHVSTSSIQDVNNGDYLGTHGILNTLMDRIGNEELWLFKKEIKGDKDIWAREDIPFAVREKLAEKWRDRMFVEVKKDNYFPIWTYTQTTAWNSLSDNEKNAMNEFIGQKLEKMGYLWEKQARTLLGELTGCTKMIACAEDLGANIDSLPLVLKDLSIMSLRVVRWTRQWNKTGQPFFSFSDYPELSVATASVHDSSTLRLWFMKEQDANDFIASFPPEASIANEVRYGQYNPTTANYLLSTIENANSNYVIHPIQDFLGLVDTYYAEDPVTEQINIPGSVSLFNWTYRLPAPIETLIKDKELTSRIANLVKNHDK